jgi:hypothetical protein
MQVQGKEIALTKHRNEDYISLTDMVKGFDGENALIEKWLRSGSTIEFLGVWETINNPDFNSLEFGGIRNASGINTFTLSVKKWVEQTGAIGIYSRTGRHHSGTFAHKDIAFEFGSWLSPQFKLYLIKEFQRLKEAESHSQDLEWNVRRVLSKTNYRLHTDAVKAFIIPESNVAKDKEGLVYASEADLLNIVMFGCTAREWKEANPSLALQGYNIREIASINELTVLANIEFYSSLLIKQRMSTVDRVRKLKKSAKEQLESLNELDQLNSIRKLNDRNSEAE